MATLLNTKWQFKENLIGIPADIEMNLTFISDGVYYKKIKWTASPGLVYTREDDVEKTVYAISGTTGLWETENYRTIEITGGADVEDETVQSALSALAVQIEDEPSTPSITTLKGATIKFKDKVDYTYDFTEHILNNSNGTCEAHINGIVRSYSVFTNFSYSKDTDSNVYTYYDFLILNNMSINTPIKGIIYVSPASYLGNHILNVTSGWYECEFTLNGYDSYDDISVTYIEPLSNVSLSNFDFPDLNENQDFISWVSQNAEVSFPEEETKYYISGTWKFKSKTVNGVVGPAVEVSETVEQDLGTFAISYPMRDDYDLYSKIKFENSTYDFDYISVSAGADWKIIGGGFDGWYGNDFSYEDCLFQFGNTPLEVSKEFYDIMHTYADEVNYSDYYTKVTGKWKWNDAITPTEKGMTIPYSSFTANNKSWNGEVNVDWMGDYFGIADTDTGIGFYLAGVGWLDGSVTANQLLAGTQPVPGTQLQTWDFGTEGVELYNKTQYKYLTENATPVTSDETKRTIKGVWKFKDMTLPVPGNSINIKGPAFANSSTLFKITQKVNFKTYYYYRFLDYNEIYIKSSYEEDLEGNPYKWRGEIKCYPSNIQLGQYDYDFISNGNTYCYWYSTYDLNGCYLDFGETEQEVSEEFYNFMHTWADSCQMSDVFRLVKGKWKWNDTLTTFNDLIENTSYFEFLAYRNLIANGTNYNQSYVGIGQVEGLFGVADFNSGKAFYLNGVGWLDGSVTVSQLMSGVTPVPSTVLQTWDFGEEGAWLTPLAYQYIQENAIQLNDTYKISGAWLLDDSILHSDLSQYMNGKEDSTYETLYVDVNFRYGYKHLALPLKKIKICNSYIVANSPSIGNFIDATSLDGENYIIAEGPNDFNNDPDYAKIFYFGEEEQIVPYEFFKLMNDFATKVELTDYFIKITGKWKWNDSLEIVSEELNFYPKKTGNYELIEYPNEFISSGQVGMAFGLSLNRMRDNEWKNDGIYINYPDIMNSWLDASVTIQEFSQGATPVPSNEFQVWDFGEESYIEHSAYNYLTENATQVTDTPTANTIKTGTYRFKDVLPGPATMDDFIMNDDGQVNFISNGTSFDCMNFIMGGDLYYLNNAIGTGTDCVYSNSNGGWLDDAYKTIIIPEDTEVTVKFYEWFNANTVPQKLMPAGVYEMKNSMLTIDILQYPEMLLVNEENGQTTLTLRTQKTFATYKRTETEDANNYLRFVKYENQTYPQLIAGRWDGYTDENLQYLADASSTPSWYGVYSDIVNFEEEQYVDYILYDLFQEHAKIATIYTLNGEIKFANKLKPFNVRVEDSNNQIIFKNVSINGEVQPLAAFTSENETPNAGFSGVLVMCGSMDVTGKIIYIEEYGWLDGSLTLGDLASGEDFSDKIIPSDKYQTWVFSNQKTTEFPYNYIMNNLYVDPDDSDTPDTPKPKIKIINPLVIFTSATKVVGTDLIVNAENVEVVGGGNN